MQNQPARPFFIRNLAAGQLLETFLVSAVAAVLAVRFFLGVTGYPRLGGGGLHIAHMLWGGGLMVAALLLLLSYLGHRIRRVAAVVGGLGFGLFIDELGKFITSDNNYFYRPAIAVIYVVFVFLFLWWRALERHRVWTPETYLANALMLLQDAALHDLDPTEQYHLIRWFRLSGNTGTSLLGNIEQALAARPPDVLVRSPVFRGLRWIRKHIDRSLRSRWTQGVGGHAASSGLARVCRPDAHRVGLSAALTDQSLALVQAVNPRLDLPHRPIYLLLPFRQAAREPDRPRPGPEGSMGISTSVLESTSS